MDDLSDARLAMLSFFTFSRNKWINPTQKSTLHDLRAVCWESRQVLLKKSGCLFRRQTSISFFHLPTVKIIINELELILANTMEKKERGRKCRE